MALHSKAVELVRELARTDSLPPYDEEGVREVIANITKLNDETAQIIAQHKERRNEVAAAIMARYSTIARDKRCVLAYLMNRLWRIQHLRWELDAEIPKEVLDNLSQREGEFLLHFDDMLTQYMEGVGIDLSSNVQQPPRDLYVEVHVVRDCTVEPPRPGGRSMHLLANTTMFLLRSQAEPLIRTGHLEHVVR